MLDNKSLRKHVRRGLDIFRSLFPEFWKMNNELNETRLNGRYIQISVGYFIMLGCQIIDVAVIDRR